MRLSRFFVRQNARTTRRSLADRRPLVEALEGRALLSTVALIQGAHIGAPQIQGAHIGAPQIQGAHIGAPQIQGAHIGAPQIQGAHIGCNA
jgi:hypothetical protein